MEARDWEQELIDEQAALEVDTTVKEVAVILLTRDVTGTPWLDWDVWAEQASDDDRLDALRTAAAVVAYMREHEAPADHEIGGSHG
ncbi:hypothetical protein [Microbacterium karelineae]|uniref:hypothetical protein n=1 Tax=Microbacterium karelineae TaxID=2654283 RepID=UPI0012EA107E|nr:hypothetical protein [Microbacterium karelineae]